ncbi:MAG: DUF2442 domain-containing protein [Rhodoferax sp.]|nr:DUF2442 domain-containing protein [Rhodoferax sp.]MBP7492725.1 DUF2442 domain-containing protein [Rhodoferax sp.]
MTTSPKAVRFDEDTLWVSLSDGRTIAAPLAWFPRLLDAAPEQRAKVELSKGGLHWDALDEDISVAGLLAGQPDLSRRANHLPV